MDDRADGKWAGGNEPGSTPPAPLPPAPLPPAEPPEDPRRERLAALYAELAAHTAPECRLACAQPHSCCERQYCDIAIDFARETWGVELKAGADAALPLLGPGGCTAAPHLRPRCTAHTCAFGEFGCKPGDEPWTERYLALRDDIVALESALFGVASI